LSKILFGRASHGFGWLHVTVLEELESVTVLEGLGLAPCYSTRKILGFFGRSKKY